jgi:nucleoside phosphorylase
MSHYVVVFAEEREVDLSRIKVELREELLTGQVTLVQTGVGKVRAATEVTNHLNSAFRSHKPRPTLISVGTCAAWNHELLETLVRPTFAVDRDGTPELLRGAGLTPQPKIRLAGESGLTIGTGDGFVADPREAVRLQGMGIDVVDMETHAVAWAGLRCMVGPTVSVRFVTDIADEAAAKDWESRLDRARTALAGEVLRLTKAPASV